MACLAALFLPEFSRADSQLIYLECLTNFETYAESVWHTAVYSNAPADAGYWGDGGSSGNGGIRGNSGIAVAYAVLVLAYPDDPRVTTRLARIRQALNFDAAAHVSGTNVCRDGHQWGWSSPSSTDWQTPEWAGSMGMAAVLVQTQLPPATLGAVQRVLASEASHRSSIAPASGYVSDTKAEENGWDSNTPALAAAWMNTDPNANLWLTAAQKYLANTYSVADTTGDPLASWVTTVTLFPDFALENHGFYHPTYQMVAGMSAGDSLLMAQLANPTVAAQLAPFAAHNVLPVWSNESHLVLDSGDFASPAGLDWELHDFEQNSYVAWLAAHFNDPLARWTDAQLARLTQYRQTVNGNGSFVGPSGGGFYREAVEARRTAIAWLHWANAIYPTGPSTPPPAAFEFLPDVGVIVQRGPFGFCSLCFGPQTNGSPARIMAIIEPPAGSVPTNAFLTTPRLPGIIGLGALGNPTSAGLVSLTTNAHGFQAELQLTNGPNGRTEVYCNCTGETVAIVEVPWPALAGSGAGAGSFAVGIENDPLTGGRRLLEWDGSSAMITNRSGASLNLSNDWVCVDARYGVAAGPAGYFNYSAASTYNRLGAAQDTLQFMAPSPPGPRYAVWFPGKNASQTASNAALIDWVTSATNATLTFPGWGGTPASVTVTLPPPPPPYPPYRVPVAAASASSWQAAYPPTNAVDTLLTDYWVSLYGPTNHAEWLKVDFPRLVSVSEFQVYPRSENGGYGPKDIQMVVNVEDTIPSSGLPTTGANMYRGSMAPTSILDVQLTTPIAASNAVLVITSGYDRGSTVDPRNTQVDELIFFERARPGTFGDWALHEFTSAQLADPGVCGPLADPDHDGAPNLLEFATGGAPLAPDERAGRLQLVASVPGSLSFQYWERKNLGDVERFFESSTDLRLWSPLLPASLVHAADLGEAWLNQATFSLPAAAGQFIRVRFTQTGG